MTGSNPIVLQERRHGGHEPAKQQRTAQLGHVGASREVRLNCARRAAVTLALFARTGVENCRSTSHSDEEGHFRLKTGPLMITFVTDPSLNCQREIPF